MIRRSGPLLATFLLALAWAPAAQASPLEASFSTPGGNEWWVEVYVEADGPLAGVDARDDGGPWTSLEKKSWGAWAKSFHVEDGSIVEFRARSTDGDSVVSGGYLWPSGDPKDGDHGGDGDGGSGSFEASFSTPGGNEWWVEVYVEADKPLAGVDARDDGGPWTSLEKKSWGAWAKSFHVEDGSIVEFRARGTGGDSVVSQGHVWPSGDPDGGGGGGGGDPGAFDASFSTPGGNEWWVEVYVEADKPLAGVDARDDGGPWTALEKRSWGAWAKSFHVEDGSIVEFRARGTGGDTDVSGGHVWPSGEPADAPPPPPDDGTDVAFGPKAGNEWWVETFVVADAQVVGVEAQVDGGPWHTLTRRSWGTWAASFHAPEGSELRFRAATPAGSDESHRFDWPGATYVDGDGTWPEEGSYAYNRMVDDPPGGFHANGWSTDVFHDGMWWRLHEWEEGFEDDTSPHEEFSTFGCKMYGPTSGVLPGQDIDITRPCDDFRRNATVREMRSQDMRLEGRSTEVTVWYASDRDPCNCVEWAVQWDDRFGLVTHAVLAGRGALGHELRDTDAPLS